MKCKRRLNKSRINLVVLRGVRFMEFTTKCIIYLSFGHLFNGWKKEGVVYKILLEGCSMRAYRVARLMDRDDIVVACMYGAKSNHAENQGKKLTPSAERYCALRRSTNLPWRIFEIEKIAFNHWALPRFARFASSWFPKNCISPYSGCSFNDRNNAKN